MAGSILVTAVYFLTSHQQSVQHNDALKAQNTELEMQISDANQKRLLIPPLEQQAAALRFQLDEFKQQAPSTEAESVIPDLIHRLAVNNHLQVAEINQGDTVSLQKGLEGVTYSVRFSGSFQGVYNTLQALEEGLRLISVSSLSLGAHTHGTEATFQLRAYRLTGVNP